MNWPNQCANPLNYKYQLKFYYFQKVIVLFLQRERVFEAVLSRCLQDKERKVRKVIDTYLRQIPLQSYLQLRDTPS